MHTQGRTENAHERYWQRRCRRLARRCMLGRVAATLGPVSLAASALIVCLILLARLEVVGIGPARVAAVAIVAIAVVGVVIAALARRLCPADLRVRLEEALGLHNQLSAAAEGAVPWPPPSGEHVPVLAWRPRQMLPLPAASVALVIAAFWLPIHPASPVSKLPVQKPPALEQLEEIAETLAEARTVDERTLETLHEQIDELAAREPEGWYTHAALEATESLLEQTENGLAELAGNFALAARSLESSAAAGQGNANDTSTPEALSAALHGMESGLLPAAGELTQMLRDAAGRNLTPDQLRQLADRLRENAGRCEGLCRGGGGTGIKRFARVGAGSSPGNPGGECDAPGMDGVSRGPGTAPLLLAENGSEAEPGATEALEGFDPSRAALGDITGQATGRHEVDRAVADAAAAGGSLATEGTGGEAAWTQNLTPEERRAVRRTFQ